MSTLAARALAPTEVASLLESMHSTIIAEVSALPAEVSAWHPAPGEWCVKECLGHIIEAERRGFNGRIRSILSEADPSFPGWDQQAVAQSRQDCGRSTADLLSEFGSLRSDSVGLVRGLRAEDLERGGTHSVVGHVRVQDLIHEWVHHDRNHFRQLQANIQAFVWANMGNCQKFVGE
jgi:DinB superfamily